MPEFATMSSLYVCNTDPFTESGEHWIVIYIDSNRQADYFDLFEMHPLIKNFKTFCITILQYGLVTKNCAIFTFRCMWLLLYIFNALHRFIGFSMNAIINMYTDNPQFNDEIVSEFVHI